MQPICQFVVFILPQRPATIGVWWSDRWRWSLAVIVTNLHIGGPWTSGYSSSYHGQRRHLAASRVTGQPLSGQDCPPLHNKKVPQQCLPYHICLAYHGWQILQQVVKLKLQRKPQKTNGLSWDPGMSEHCLTGTSPQDLKGEQPLLQRSWLSITSISLHWVKQDLLIRVC